MTKIIYDSQNLIIDIQFDKQAECVKWGITTDVNISNIHTRTQIKTLIETLQKSLDLEWEPQT